VAWPQAVPIVYEGIRIEVGFRADLIVEDKVIVEIKSVETVAPVHNKQLLTHLRLADKRLGLLINFNVVLIKEGSSASPTACQIDLTQRRQGAKMFSWISILCEKPIHLAGLRRSLVSLTFALRGYSFG
jgi:hypothetical protein